MFRNNQRTIPRVATLWCTALLTLLTATSCFDSSGDCSADKGSVKVAFTLSLAEPTSRATNDDWSDYNPAEPGTQKENNINRNDVQVGLYDEQGKLVGAAKDIVCIRTDDKAQTYTFSGSWEPESAEQLSQVKHIKVLANCGNPVLGSTVLDDLTFNQAAAYIPLWGVAEISEALQIGKSTDLGKIDLLRAMAKVEVVLREDMKNLGYTLGAVTLHRYNKRGYCLPGNHVDVTNTAELTFEQTFRPLSSAAATPATLSLAGGTEVLDPKVVYVTEYDNLTTPTNAAYLTVELKHNGTTEGTYTLAFCKYTTEGAPTEEGYNLVRNHLYRFTLHRSNARLNVNLIVRPWELYEHDEVVM